MVGLLDPHVLGVGYDSLGAVLAGKLAVATLFELTGDCRVILPLIVSTAIAHLVMNAFLADSVMTEKLSRRGLRVSQQFESGSHGANPIVDGENGLVGILARDDLLREPQGDGQGIMEIASRDMVSVTPDDSVLIALRKMPDEHIEHLPVVEGDRHLGTCTPNLRPVGGSSRAGVNPSGLRSPR